MLDIIKFASSNDSVKFLQDRILCDDYRGNHISQHNRYQIEHVISMLRELFNISGMEKMQIRTTDISKRPYNYPEESKYAEYVEKVCSIMGRGTQDSIRKNLFVDFHRMGFIERYDQNGYRVDPYSRSAIKYVSLTNQGYKLIKEKNVFNQRMLYSKGLDNLLSNSMDDLLSIVIELRTFNDIEYTFFISACNQEFNGKFYSKDDVVKFVNSYRHLSRYQKEAIEKAVHDYMNPNNFVKGNKLDKRDFHNWINETQQIFMLLDQTVYFEKRGNVMYPRVGDDAIFDDDVVLDRSLKEKKLYFTYHSVSKTPGFELHHIVPLCWAENRNEFVVLDNHKNLVYIDGYKHSIITQNNNNNVILNFNGNDATFTDSDDNEVYCENTKNIIYNPKNQKEMLKYNKNLLDSVIQ